MLQPHWKGSLQYDHMVNVLGFLQPSAQISAMLAALHHGGTALHHVPVVPTESMLHATIPTSRANLFDTTHAKSVQ